MTALSVIRTEVRDLANLDANDAILSDAKLDRFINAALQRLSTTHDWWWNEVETFFTTVVGQVDYALPANHRKTRALYAENNDVAFYQPRDAKQFADYNNTMPRVYTIEAGTLKLYPTPANISIDMTHVYTATEPVLSADTDEPLLPSEYTDYLVVMTVIRVAVMVKDEEMYRLAINERDDWKRRADDDVRKTRSNVRIRTRRDWRV